MATGLRIAYCVLALGLLVSLSPVFAAEMPGAQPGAPETTPMAIRGGSIVLKVTDYGAARAAVLRLAAARKAVLRQEKSEANFAGERHGVMVLTVDSDRLTPLMDEIRSVGKLYSENVETSDQTSDYEKLGTRITLLKQNEDELVGFLHSPRRMRGSDILFVQSRLFDSRVQSANVAQDRIDIGRRARQSLLSVSMFEPEPRKAFDWGNWHAVASYRAKGSFLYVARKAVTGFFFALYFAPLWIPAALILFFGGRKLLRWMRQSIAALWERYRARTVTPRP